jgi:capsular polysaccharide biosynthesis protein
MEVKAYIEGILRAWWLLGLAVVLSFGIGGSIASHQTSQYSASTSILINDTLPANIAFPSGRVQIGTPLSYQSLVASPAIFETVIKTYPGLTASDLQKSVTVETDTTNQFLLISVTALSPERAADIANYLTQHFVSTQTANLNQQADYYDKWLRQNISLLQDDIQRLGTETQQLQSHSAGPITNQRISENEYTLDRDERNLYNYQQAFIEIQNSRPLFKDAYSIMQPAIASDASAITTTVSISRTRLIAMAIGFLIAILLIVLIEYFHPLVRHKGELERIAGLSVLATLPQLSSFEQQRLLQLRPTILRWRIDSLRLLCVSIGASAVKFKGHTVLLTSPRRKRSFASVLATFLAYNGHRTLLIDANLKHPYLHEQIKLADPCKLVTNGGLLLSFIRKAMLPHLFVLPATATLAQNEPLTSTSLLALLPELQNVFDIIIIDAPPLNDADAHLLATKIGQTLILVKKRRDSLKTLKMTHALCKELKLSTQCLLLA